MTEEYKTLHADFAAWFQKQEDGNRWASDQECRAAYHLMKWLESLARLRKQPAGVLLEILAENAAAFKKAREKAEGKSNGDHVP